MQMSTHGDDEASRKDLLDQVAEKVREVTGAERSAVVFGEDANATIHFVAATGLFAERIRGARGPAEGSGLCGNVLDGGCSILSKQTLGDERIHQGIAVEMAISTALGAPVFHDEEPFAVLMAMNRAGGGSFSEAVEAALNAYATEVADTLWLTAARTD
jgi:GAF domain-containing protein